MKKTTLDIFAGLAMTMRNSAVLDPERMLRKLLTDLRNRDLEMSDSEDDEMIAHYPNKLKKCKKTATIKTVGLSNMHPA